MILGSILMAPDAVPVCLSFPILLAVALCLGSIIDGYYAVAAMVSWLCLFSLIISWFCGNIPLTIILLCLFIILTGVAAYTWYLKTEDERYHHSLNSTQEPLSDPPPGEEDSFVDEATDSSSSSWDFPDLLCSRAMIQFLDYLNNSILSYFEDYSDNPFSNHSPPSTG